jgi:hypothetical protein
MTSVLVWTTETPIPPAANPAPSEDEVIYVICRTCRYSLAADSHPTRATPHPPRGDLTTTPAHAPQRFGRYH